ncbi:hypothetical protein BKA65DRAFT_555115 [Rhexocercosporidium sp. MPI-PUGE-AT-0058]|nr:hypothetical protein BKA65DRAFT_555115 [Rhexocercosporidium sp. MPI-PUGE-AT-0058]
MPLVFVTVEAAYTEQFRTYAHKLAATQDLGRIIFDEAHLTITASDYRQAIVDLALIRNVPEQKEELLRMWLASSDQPYIVATSALSAGFDYTYVRLIVHVDEPSSLVDFA